MFSSQTENIFDQPAAARNGGVSTWLALLPGLLLIAWALLRAAF